MKTRIHHILIFVCLVCFAAVPVAAQEAPENPFGLSAAEMVLFERINQARTNPLGTAEAMGLDRNQILEDLPELHDILVNGLPAFNLNEMLTNAARSHTQDMFSRNYYSHTTPDGITYQDRIIESGYEYAVSGETLGVIGFLNFIEEDAAAETIFQNIFMDELNPERVENRNILAPDLKEVGLALGSGVFSSDDVSFNAFAATCDFGSLKTEDVDIDSVEKELFVLINQFRDNPEAAAAAYGIDIAALRTAVNGQEDMALESLPPLGRHEVLYQTAKAHSIDMVERRYYDTITPDGVKAADRLSEAGYEALTVHETLGLLNHLPLVHSTADIARMLFESLLHDAIEAPEISENPLFNGELNEIGIGADSLILDEGAGPVAYYVVTLDAARSIEDRFTLSGVVFKDANGNGLYDAGEGGGKRNLIALGRWPNYQIPCDTLGGYSSAVDAGYYILMLFRANGEQETQLKQAALPGVNDWVMFTVDQVLELNENLELIVKEE